MRKLSDLVHAHRGRPAFVLGGGPSLPGEFAQCPADAVKLSANHHGQILTPCDYLVAQEVIDESYRIFRSFDVPLVSPRADADVVIDCPKLALSGWEATRAAWVMGCAPIVLAGMDCYTQAVDYWHRPEFQGYYGRDDPGPPRKLPKQLRGWRGLEAGMPHAMLRSCGGPLRAIFRAYEPGEPAVAVASAAEIREHLEAWRWAPATN